MFFTLIKFLKDLLTMIKVNAEKMKVFFIRQSASLERDNPDHHQQTILMKTNACAMFEPRYQFRYIQIIIFVTKHSIA